MYCQKFNTCSTVKTLLHGHWNFQQESETCTVNCKVLLTLWWNCDTICHKFCIHVWQEIWTSFSKIVDTCMTLYKCNVSATVFNCIGCASTIFVYSILVFIIVSELGVSTVLSSGTQLDCIVSHCIIVYHIVNILQIMIWKLCLNCKHYSVCIDIGNKIFTVHISCNVYITTSSFL